MERFKPRERLLTIFLIGTLIGTQLDTAKRLITGEEIIPGDKTAEASDTDTNQLNSRIAVEPLNQITMDIYNDGNPITIEVPNNCAVTHDEFGRVTGLQAGGVTFITNPNNGETQIAIDQDSLSNDAKQWLTKGEDSGGTNTIVLSEVLAVCQEQGMIVDTTNHSVHSTNPKRVFGPTSLALFDEKVVEATQPKSSWRNWEHIHDLTHSAQEQ